MADSPEQKKRGRGRPSVWDELAVTRLGNDLIAWLQADDDNIFVEDFLSQHGLYRQAQARLTSKFEVFRDLIKAAKEIQEIKINRLALKQKVNPVMAIFLLKNHHGYADKQEIKTENLNYNYDPADLRAKTADELLDLLNQETNTTH